MPNRILRDWTDSEAVNSLSPGAEVLFVRLIQKADDFGRYTANPKLLRPNLFPLRLDAVREADLDRWIAECVKASLVRLYEVDGKRFLVIEKFGQRVRADVSRYPDPPLSGTCLPNDGHVTVKGPSRDGPPRTETKTIVGDEVEGVDGRAGLAPRRRARATALSPEALQAFERFWAVYPKPAGRQDAERAWAKLKAEEQELAIARAAVYAEAKRGEEQRFLKDASGWLNGKRFNDDPAAWGTPRVRGALVGAHPAMPRPRPARAPEGASLPPPPPDGGVWPRVLEELRSRVDERDFETWFRGTRQVGELNGSLRVAVGGPLFLEYIPREYSDAIGEALKACGVSVPVEYLTDEAGGEA